MKKGRKISTFVLWGILIFSIWQVIGFFAEYQRNQEIYENARELVIEEESAGEDTEQHQEKESLEDDRQFSGAPEEQRVDFEALKAINPDIFGWILIEGTPIDYPLLQGEDNSYYLTHTYDRKEARCGSIFLECTNTEGMTDQHNILYGHNMRDDSMFGSLSEYNDQEYAEQHKEIKIYLEDRVQTYQIFSVYRAETSGKVYTVQFGGKEGFQKMLDEMTESSVVELLPNPGAEDRILTLSTCTGSGNYERRLVINAVLVKESGYKGRKE